LYSSTGRPAEEFRVARFQGPFLDRSIPLGVASAGKEEVRCSEIIKRCWDDSQHPFLVHLAYSSNILSLPALRAFGDVELHGLAFL